MIWPLRGITAKLNLLQTEMPVNQENARPITVILADDNQAMRDVVVQLLTPEFRVVSTFSDGQALVQAVSRLKPNVGIIDISMPIMNGIEAAIEIRKLGSDMKIIFLTVNEDSDFVQAAFDAGASAYVMKRKMASDLVVGLREALAGRKFVSS